MLIKGLILSLIMPLIVMLAVFPAGAQEKAKAKPQEEKAEGTKAQKPEGSEEQTGIPTGKISFKVTQAAVGLGYTWGDGTLNFKGKDYKFKVSGLNLIGLGVASISAIGEVYNLTKLKDFPGKYFGVEAGATFIKGSAGLLVKNSSGVVLNLKTQQKGVELKLGNQGLSISPDWK